MVGNGRKKGLRWRQDRAEHQNKRFLILAYGIQERAQTGSEGKEDRAEVDRFWVILIFIFITELLTFFSCDNRYNPGFIDRNEGNGKKEPKSRFFLFQDSFRGAS